jgi:hypothetical protein
VLGTSSAADEDFTCSAPNGPPCRWGDYAGATPDPLNDQAVWGSNQLNGPQTTDPAWLTRNFALADAAAGYARPKGASPLRASLVPAFGACTAANTTHGSPLASPSCNPPAQASGFLTVGTPDANGAGPNSIGAIQLDSIPGDPSTPTIDDADVRLSASITDVRLKADLGDYAGQLQANVGLRMTDRDNGAGEDTPATVSDLTYQFTIGCGATADTLVGGTCSVTTTADTLVPGTVKEGKRALWQLDQVRVFDGGADGVASTAPNTLFEVEGVFVP